MCRISTAFLKIHCIWLQHRSILLMPGHVGTWSGGYNSEQPTGKKRLWMSTMCDKTSASLRFHLLAEMPGINLDALESTWQSSSVQILCSRNLDTFPLLTDVLQHQVKDVRQTLYLQFSWLCLLCERLRTTVLSTHIYRAIIALPTSFIMLKRVVALVSAVLETPQNSSLFRRFFGRSEIIWTPALWLICLLLRPWSRHGALLNELHLWEAREHREP